MPASPADSSSLLVIIAIICLTMGYVFGWLISSLQHSKEDKKAKAAEPADTPVEAEAASEKVQAAETTVPETPAAFFQLREGAEGLMVGLGGKTVSDAASLTIRCGPA